MATIRFKNIGIQAIAACVPQTIVSNNSLEYLISEQTDMERIIQSTGIKERRIATDNICASDLCERAARKLLEDNNINPESIDALIFVSQTPDYHQPATAMSIQNKLGLPKSTLSFDINLACSGYIYGLSTAFAYAQLEGINKVLLLAGDTLSKTISSKDKATVPLFGDAGTATLIEKGYYPDSFFTLNSDGDEAWIINIPYGGYRHPSCFKGFEDIVDRDGNVRNGEQLNMDGAEVFHFGLREVPKDIKNLIAFAGETIENIDLIIYHQANKYMTDFFTKKLKFFPDRTPYSLSKFGNTTSASIPLTIVSELVNINIFNNRKKVIISGFGAGLSWGSALVDLSDTKISNLIEL